MTAPVRSCSPALALPGLACLLPIVLCCACGGVSPGVRDRGSGSFPRAAIVDSDGLNATVIPESGYAAGGLEAFFIGKHYRDLWGTPIRVPILDLSTYAGGLTPLRRGGGLQTLSLRLRAPDGRQFVFRTVAKDQRNLLPAAWRSTLIADILQDQVSAMNPAGALVVDELAHALGVHHAHPVLVLAPDDARLGEFRREFAGRLGILEDYPVAGDAGSPPVAGADTIVSTRKLFKSLGRNSADRVDSRSFLTARLLDMLVGDWDRHGEQWRWARNREQGRYVYHALPRDRDQAFARLDGVFPRLAGIAAAQMEHFSEDFGDIAGLMHTGRVVDRRILADLDKSTWESVVSSVVTTLTDEVIENAVRRLPQPYQELRGAWLADALKSRRDRLRAAAASYYRSLSASVDIHLSDEPEHVVVLCRDDRSATVTAYLRDKGTGGLRGRPVYTRTYHPEETAEVRIHLHGGADTAVVSGSTRPGVRVRVVGDAGVDEFVDGSSIPQGLEGSISFFPRSREAKSADDPGGGADPAVAD